jgi:dATP pyrophosphohydrolase
MTSGYKQPVSVLVVIYTATLDVLLLERSAHPGFWQSVTGSREGRETLIDTARREVLEETGIDTASGQLVEWQMANSFEIFTEWRHRYAPGITHNIEHVFSLQLTDRPNIVTAPDEHRDWQWLPWQEAAERCFSWTNRDAILMLSKKPFFGT